MSGETRTKEKLECHPGDITTLEINRRDYQNKEFDQTHQKNV